MQHKTNIMEIFMIIGLIIITIGNIKKNTT